MIIIFFRCFFFFFGSEQQINKPGLALVVASGGPLGSGPQVGPPRGVFPPTGVQMCRVCLWTSVQTACRDAATHKQVRASARLCSPMDVFMVLSFISSQMFHYRPQKQLRNRMWELKGGRGGVNLCSLIQPGSGVPPSVAQSKIDFSQSQKWIFWNGLGTIISSSNLVWGSWSWCTTWSELMESTKSDTQTSHLKQYDSTLLDLMTPYLVTAPFGPSYRPQWWSTSTKSSFSWPPNFSTPEIWQQSLWKASFFSVVDPPVNDSWQL